MTRPGIALVLSLIAIVPTLTAADPCPSDLDCKILDVPLYSQTQGVWCWAAGAQMILAFFGDEVLQCQQASDLANDPYWGQGPPINCCEFDLSTGQRRSGDQSGHHYEESAEEVIKACVRGGSPRFGNFGFDSQSTSQQCKLKYEKENKPYVKNDCALTWEAVKTEIDSNRPFAFSWYLPWGSHLMVATGYVETRAGEKWVVTNDPWPPGNADTSLFTYEYYVRGPKGSHFKDFRAIRPARFPVPPTSEDDLITFPYSIGSDRGAADTSPSDKFGIGWFETGDARVKLWEAALQPAISAIRIFLDSPQNPPFLVPPPRKTESAAKDLTLHSPGFFEVSLVDLDDLMLWREGGKPKLEVEEVIIPIFRSDVVSDREKPQDSLHTAVTLRKSDDGWKAVSVGRSTLTKSLHDVLERLAPDSPDGILPSRHALPSLGFLFNRDGSERAQPLRLIHQACCYEAYLEDRDSGKWYALYDNDKQGFKRGKEVDPEQLWKYLMGCGEVCAAAVTGPDPATSLF